MTQSITASKSQQNNPKSAEREAPFVGRLSVGKIGNKPRLSGNSAAVALAAASFSAGGALGGGGLVNFTKLNDAEYNSDLLYATLIVFPKLPLLKRQEFLLSLLREADPMDMDFIFESLPRLHRDFIRLLPASISFKIVCYVQPRDICIMCCVSQYWRKLCHSSELWLQLYSNIGLSSMMTHYYNKAAPMKINTSRIHSLSNWAKGSFKRKAISAHNMGILAVSLHKSRLVATASADKTAKLFDLHAGICVRTFVGHELSVGCVQMDSSKVITGSADTTIKIWSIKDGLCYGTLTGHEKNITCLKFVHSTLISGSLDKKIKIWIINEKTSSNSPSSQNLGGGGSNKDKDSLGGLQPQQSSSNPASTMASTASLSTDSSSSSMFLYTQTPAIITMTREQIVKDALRYVDKHTPSIVHLSGQCIRTLHGHESGVKCLDFFGHILVSGDTLGFLKIWHVQSGNCLHTVDTNLINRNPESAPSIFSTKKPSSPQQKRKNAGNTTSSGIDKMGNTTFDPISCIHFTGARLIFGKFSGDLFLYETRSHFITDANEKEAKSTSLQMNSVAGTASQYEFLRRWVEDPTSFSLLHVYNLGSGEVMKTEQWLDSKVAFEDKKMAFKPFKIPGIVVQNNSNDQRPHTTTGGGTKASNVLQTNLLGIDEESVGPFSKRGAGGGHSTGPATVTTSLVEKQAPLLATRTWALCVQMDAWRLMCGGSEGRFVLWNHREATKMKSLMGGDAADDNNEQQAPILILDDQPIDFDADLEEVQDESTAAAAAYKMGLQTSNFNLSQKKTDAQKKQFGGTAMTKSLQNNNVSKTAKRGSSTSNTIKKSKPSGVEIALHSGSNTSDKDNNTNNEEKEETTLIINNKLANAAYRIPTATERDNLVKTVDVSVGKSITGVTFDDRYVVAGSMDGILRIWDCDSTGVNKF